MSHFVPSLKKYCLKRKGKGFHKSKKRKIMDENLYSCDVELTNLMGSFDDFSSCFSSRVLGDNDVFFFDLFCLDLKCKSHVVAMMYIFKIFIPGNIKRYVFEAIPKINIKYTKAKENTSLEEYENSKSYLEDFLFTV